MTSDGRVPLDRPPIEIAEIATKAPVRARTWGDMAALAHWVAGRGTMLVPQHRCMIGLNSAGTNTNTLRYYVRPQGRAIARVWIFEVRGRPGFPGLLTFQPGTTFTVSPEYPVEPEAFGTRMAPIVIVEGAGVETELTRSTTDAQIACAVECTAGQVLIVSCAVWEVPRAALGTDATDLGISRDTFFPRQPIERLDYASVGGVIDLARDLTFQVSDRPRTRSGHIARWGPLMEVSSGTATSLTVTDYYVVPGLDRAADTTTTLSAYFHGFNGNGTIAAQWRVVCGSSGATAWQNLGIGASWTGPVTFTAKCEDPTTADGLRGGSPDTVRFEMRAPSGSLAWAYGWCVVE